MNTGKCVIASSAAVCALERSCTLHSATAALYPAPKLPPNLSASTPVLKLSGERGSSRKHLPTSLL